MIMIAVMLVGGQRLSREGVGHIIAREKDMHIAGLASTEAEAFNILQAKELDVVLINIHTLATDGITMMINMFDLYPDLKVILITNYEEEDLVFSGVLNGAHGFISLKISGEHMVQLIRKIFDDQIIISGQAARILVDAVLETKYDNRQILGQRLIARGIHLTERELDVAYLLKKETSNNDISKQLYISEGTTKNYISVVYSKLQLKSRSNVIRYLNEIISNHD